MDYRIRQPEQLTILYFFGFFGLIFLLMFIIYKTLPDPSLLNRSAGIKEVSIFYKNELIKRLNINEEKKFTFLDGRMIIQVKNGGVRVLKSDCPGQICVRTGVIKSRNKIIACLPNRILVTVHEND